MEAWFDQMKKGKVRWGWPKPRDKEREEVIKIINASATITVHICTVTIAIVHLCTIATVIVHIYTVTVACAFIILITSSLSFSLGFEHSHLTLHFFIWSNHSSIVADHQTTAVDKSSNHANRRSSNHADHPLPPIIKPCQSPTMPIKSSNEGLSDHQTTPIKSSNH